MANKKISELPAATTIDPANDLLELADVSASASVKATPAQLIAGAAPDANGNTEVLGQWEFVNAGTSVAHGDSLAIGGTLRLHCTSSPSNASLIVQTNGGAAGRTTAQGGVAGYNCYLSNNTGANVIKRLDLLMENRASLDGGPLPAAFTILLSDLPIVASDGSGISLNPYNIHIQTGVGAVTSVQVGTAGGGGVGPSISAINPHTGSGTGPYPWTNGANMPLSSKFPVSIQLDGINMRITVFGQALLFQDPSFATNAPKYAAVEVGSPSTTGFSSFGVIHEFTINSDKHGDDIQARSDQLAKLLSSSALPSNILTSSLTSVGTLGSLTVTGTTTLNSTPVINAGLSMNPSGTAPRLISFGGSFGAACLYLSDFGAAMRYGFGINANEVQCFAPSAGRWSWNKGGGFQSSGTNEVMAVDATTGSLKITGGAQIALVTKTANYTATGADHTILCDTTSAGFTITLPAAASNSGRIYVIKKTSADANNVTIDPNASELIEGAATFVFNTQNMSIEIQSNGTGWFIISSYSP